MNTYSLCEYINKASMMNAHFRIMFSYSRHKEVLVTAPGRKGNAWFMAKKHEKEFADWFEKEVRC